MVEVKLPKINQPIYVLISFLIGLGFAENYNLQILKLISLIGSIWATTLVIISMTWYTITYMKKS